MTTDKQREAFEARMIERGFTTGRYSYPDGAYYETAVQYTWDGFGHGYRFALQSQSARIEELETICAEAYQVVGQFSDMLPDAKILDNLSQQRLVHKDVLPFKPVQSPEVQKLRKALEWYADPVLPYAITQTREPRSAVHADGGEIAREALQPFTKG